MKKVVLLVLIAVCCLPACKKSTPISPGLFGKWELRSKYGGLAGLDSTYKAGNGNIYQFNSDSTYSHYVNKTLTTTGAFHIKPGDFHGVNAEFEIYFDNTTYGEPFALGDTRMTIGAGAPLYDGIAADYEKIKN